MYGVRKTNDVCVMETNITPYASRFVFLDNLMASEPSSIVAKILRVHLGNAVCEMP